MVTQTTNYNFDKPDPGGDKDTWGIIQNGALDGVDTQIKVNDDVSVAASGVNATNISDNQDDIGVNKTDITTNAQAITDLTQVVADLSQQILDERVPLGGLYLSTVSTNPGDSSQLDYGTWVLHAGGRALIGVGSNAESTWDVNDERGSETHTLTEAELASHAHGMNITQRASAGGGADYVVGGGTDEDTNNAGGDISHNNIQPSIAINVWRRTA